MKILLAYDKSKFAEEAKNRAAKLAKVLNAELSIVAVIPDFCCPIGEVPQEYFDTIYDQTVKNTEKFLQDTVAGLALNGVVAKPILEKGHPAEKILETAEAIHADLIVVGSRGMHGVERFFLGSVSSKVAIHAKCDVLIVK